MNKRATKAVYESSCGIDIVFLYLSSYRSKGWFFAGQQVIKNRLLKWIVWDRFDFAIFMFELNPRNWLIIFKHGIKIVNREASNTLINRSFNDFEDTPFFL